MDTPKYPTRPRFFAYRFVRLMAKVCLANELGTDAFTLLAVVAHTEDAKGYSEPVTFYNEQLLPMVGLGSVDTLDRVRRKVTDAGWLVYLAGGRRRAGRYWVTIPARFARFDDAPSDERPEKYTTDTVRTDAEVSAEVTADQGTPSSASVRRESRSICGTNRGQSAEPSSLTLPLAQEDSPSASGSAVAATAVAKQTGPAKKQTKTASPRREPTGPHHEAVRSFCAAWESKYGTKYPFNAGKDAAAVKWMLGQVGGDPAKFAAAVNRYLDDPDPFYANDRHTLGMLRAKFARWLVEGQPHQKQLSQSPRASAASVAAAGLI